MPFKSWNSKSTIPDWVYYKDRWDWYNRIPNLKTWWSTCRGIRDGLEIEQGNFTYEEDHQEQKNGRKHNGCQE